MQEIWKGRIIDKSLKDLSVLSLLNIIESNIEENTSGAEKKIWTLYTVEMREAEVRKVSRTLEKKIKSEYYIHFTNGKKLLIIFKDKSFVINLDKVGKDEGNGIVSFVAKPEDKEIWKAAFKYGTKKAKIDPRYLVEVN